MKRFGTRIMIAVFAVAPFIAMLARIASAATLTPVVLSEAANFVRATSQVAATSGGDVCADAAGTFLLVNNTDSSPHTVTVTAEKTSVYIQGQGYLTKASITQAVSASDEVLLGPFPPSYFADGQGNIEITYSAVTGVKVACIRLDNSAR
jgi:hypothetical protein